MKKMLALFQIGTEAFENGMNILGGHIKFHTRIGGYVPAEDIENVFEFDPTITQAALEGGAE